MLLIRYKIVAEVDCNHAIYNAFTDKEIKWSPENEELAKAEAYNGKYIIEDDGQPELTPTTEQRISYLEEQLAQSDETAITLYEAQEAQEVINAQQDEALMEIYEMIR